MAQVILCPLPVVNQARWIVGTAIKTEHGCRPWWPAPARGSNFGMQHGRGPGMERAMQSDDQAVDVEDGQAHAAGRRRPASPRLRAGCPGWRSDCRGSIGALGPARRAAGVDHQAGRVRGCGGQRNVACSSGTDGDQCLKAVFSRSRGRCIQRSEGRSPSNGSIAARRALRRQKADSPRHPPGSRQVLAAGSRC